jgi:hypothetical protein
MCRQTEPAARVTQSSIRRTQNVRAPSKSGVLRHLIRHADLEVEARNAGDICKRLGKTAPGPPEHEGHHQAQHAEHRSGFDKPSQATREPPKYS